MDSPYLGMIFPIAFNFAPDNYMLCQGQLLSVSSYETLYSLIGNTFGGNATQFALPDLRGVTPVGQGQLPGGQTYTIGQKGGAIAQTLLPANVPPHTHSVNVSMMASSSSDQSAPGNHIQGPAPSAIFNTTPNARSFMAAPNVSVSKSAGLPSFTVNSMSPFIAIQYMICVKGLYPQRP